MKLALRDKKLQRIRKVDCRMKVPLSFNETSASNFKATKCGDVYFFSNPDDED